MSATPASAKAPSGDEQTPAGVFVLQVDKSAAEPEVDLVAAWRFIMRNKFLIAAGFVLGAILGVVWAQVATRVYRAEVTVSILSDRENSSLAALQSRFAGLANLAGIDLSADEGSQAEAVALLSSRSFIEDFIAEQKILPVLFESSWNAKERRWLPDRRGRVPTLQDGYEVFVRDVMQTEEDRRTGLVTVQMEWPDRMLPARWANALIARADRTMRNRAITQADAAMRYLERELQKTNVVEVRQALFSVVQRQVQKRTFANSRPEYSFRVLDGARPSEPHRYVRPAKTAIVAGSAVAGALLAVLLATWRGRRSGTAGGSR